MYLLGHVGVALLVFAPVSYRLVRDGRHRRAGAGGAALLLLASAPDIDSQLAFLSHRGLTHTVWAALGLGVAVGLAWWVLAPPGVPDRDETAGFGFLVGAASGGSHLLGDAITPMGVRPLAPATDLNLAFGLAEAADPGTNLALLTVGLAVWVAAVVVGHRRRYPWARDPDVHDPVTSRSTEPVRVPVRDGRHVRRADGGYEPGERRSTGAAGDGSPAD